MNSQTKKLKKVVATMNAGYSPRFKANIIKGEEYLIDKHDISKIVFFKEVKKEPVIKKSFSKDI